MDHSVLKLVFLGVELLGRILHKGLNRQSTDHPHLDILRLVDQWSNSSCTPHQHRRRHHGGCQQQHNHKDQPCPVHSTSPEAIKSMSVDMASNRRVTGA